MVFKKLVAAALSALMILCFSGCNGFNFNVDELLVSPKLEGDMRPVQHALEEAVGENITLKYPALGEKRSAFILKDIDGNGTNEAFAFYSTTTDNTVTMHVNVIEQVDNKWKSRGDLGLIGNGIESVSFADLDGNGKLEIIVGWYIFGVTEKQVGIYTYEGELLTLRAIEPYTNFTYADLTGDTVDDLAVIYLNSTEATATAKLLSLSKKGITEVGVTKLDPGVSSYNEPVLSKLSDNTPALYIDAVNGSGMITEILWYKDGALNGIYNPETPENAPTYRSGTVASRDYDLNGTIDIPLSEILISTSKMADSDKIYYTNWAQFNGTEFEPFVSVLMNYGDGYSITVPSELKQKLLVIRKLESRARFFYNYNLAEETVGEECFRIVTVSATEYDKEAYDKNGYSELLKTDSLVHLSRVAEDNDLGITKEQLKSMFNLLQ